MHKKLITTISALFICLAVFPQLKEINGTVSDEKGNLLVGANVIIKGTYLGTATDHNGKYTLKASAGDILLVSMLGFTSKEIKVVNQNTINIKLKEGFNLSEIAVIGSRNNLRMTTETALPIDILDIKDLSANSPQISLGEIMNFAAPSFSSNTQTISDGTDHVDPASLRGLGPDHLLVLINGKRRHTSSLININGTVGRGSVGTDLNAIPVAAIERIEVLRDGASAQYGSDAIAGVMNIVLKKNINTLHFSYTTGANFSSEGEQTDGQKNLLTANYGIPVGNNGGLIHFTGEMHMREPTDRNGDFEGQIYNRYNVIERLALNDGYNISDLSTDIINNYAVGLGFDESSQNIDPGQTALQSFLNDDASNQELTARGLDRSDFNIRSGQSRLRESKLFINFNLPVNNTTELYAFGGMSFRNGNSGGFYRLPYQERNYTPIYFNGFIPEINTQIVDRSLSTGIKSIVHSWTIDFSNTYGYNSFGYEIGNTLNASMESDSPISMYAGSHSFIQNTTNLDLSRFWKDKLEGLHIAWGLEHRLENFRMMAGEESSYALYDKNGNVVNGIADPSLTVTDLFGNNRPGGAQVFPGFRPENERNKYRSSIAVYADIEADMNKHWLVNAALRFENYSDFGNTLNYKMASRYKLSDNFSVRAAYSTGFRAPSLHQLYFNRVNTQFIGGIPYEIGTYSNDSKIARLLGIPELKQERSRNFNAGMSLQIPSLNLRMSADAFLITIRDRITYTGSFSATNSPEDAKLAAILDQAGASSATFFANSIDARSKGIDLVFNHHSRLGKGILNTNFSATISQTQHIGDINASAQLANKLDTYFNEFDRVLLESASPKTKMHLNFNYQCKKLNVYINESYFGNVTHASRVVADQQVLSAKLLTDISMGYQFTDRINLTIGANNLFDVYPDKILPDNADYSSGRFPYSRRSTQFGFAGRFLFARVSYSLSD